jgi:hypothetical protein
VPTRGASRGINAGRLHLLWQRLFLVVLLLLVGTRNQPLAKFGDDIMTKFQRTWALAAVMLLGLAGLVALAQKKPAVAAPAAKVEEPSPMLLKLDAGEQQRVRAAVARPAPVTIEAVVQEFNGPFDSVAGHMDEFLKEFKEQKLNAGLKGNPIGLLIVYSEPQGNTAHLGVGVEVTGALQPKAPLKLEHFTTPQGIRVVHEGDYGKLEGLHHAIHEQAQHAHKRGTSFPSVVRLLDDPRKVARPRYELVEKLQ